jgi:hypothetical protein
VLQRDDVGRDPGAELHVPPALARAFQQAGRIGQQRTKEEADVDVIPERGNVAECGLADARGRAAVVHQLAHVVAAAPHAREPGCTRGR